MHVMIIRTVIFTMIFAGFLPFPLGRLTLTLLKLSYLSLSPLSIKSSSFILMIVLHYTPKFRWCCSSSFPIHDES